MPWTCELARSFSPSGLQRSHSPTSRATGAPQRAHGWVGPAAGSGRAAGAGIDGCGHRSSMVPRIGRNPEAGGRARDARRYQRSTASTRASTSGGRPGEDDRPVRAGLVPALPGRARLAAPTRVSAMSASPSQSPWKPTRRAGPRVAGRPPRAPRGRAAGSARSCRRTSLQPSPIRPASRAPAGVSPPMMIGGGGVGTGNACAPRAAGRTATGRVTGPPVHSARMTATASSSRATRSFGVGELDPVGRVLLRCAADARSRGSAARRSRSGGSRPSGRGPPDGGS